MKQHKLLCLITSTTTATATITTRNTYNSLTMANMFVIKRIYYALWEIVWSCIVVDDDDDVNVDVDVDDCDNNNESDCIDC